MPSKIHVFLIAVLAAAIASFFGEWIDAQKISFASYSYFLMALCVARCYLFCILILGILSLYNKNVSVAAEFLVFLPVIANGILILLRLPFNALMLYSRLATILQVAAATILFASGAALSFRRQEGTIHAQNSSYALARLSKREKEVAVLLLEGMKNDEIAEALFISAATVKSHVQHILEKYDARNRMEFAAKARGEEGQRKS